MKVHALILGNIAPLSGCEFKNSKALDMITTSQNSLYLPHVCRCIYPDFVTCEDQPALCTVTSTFVSRVHIHFVEPDLGPNCLLN